MLKTAEVYDVSITLNDGQKLHCLLLDKPDALTLAAIAEAESADRELTEAVAFVRDLAIANTSTEVGENVEITEITVAGTMIGSVQIVTLSAYRITPKRGRKPKPTETAGTTETPTE